MKKIDSDLILAKKAFTYMNQLWRDETNFEIANLQLFWTRTYEKFAEIFV